MTSLNCSLSGGNLLLLYELLQEVPTQFQFVHALRNVPQAITRTSIIGCLVDFVWNGYEKAKLWKYVAKMRNCVETCRKMRDEYTRTGFYAIKGCVSGDIIHSCAPITSHMHKEKNIWHSHIIAINYHRESHNRIFRKFYYTENLKNMFGIKSWGNHLALPTRK